MTPYSPFDKPLSKLQSSDLTALRSVSEGWYVEYKVNEVKSADYAKAISAFANTYGGWLFIGIAEKSKENPVAGAFSGIPVNELDACLQRLRQSAATFLNPTPYFETISLKGPCSAIGLAEERVIVCVMVPQSITAPHIHKDGRIYRRVADSSEPRPETDRHTLDQLFRRGEDFRKDTEIWIQQDPEFSKAEAKAPYLRLIFAVDPWMQRDPWLDAPFKDIRTLMRMEDSPIQSMPFDSVHHSSGGIIARQVRNNDPRDLGLTMKFSRDLSGELLVPLTLLESDKYTLLAEELSDYAHASRYLKILQSNGFSCPRIVDLNILFTAITGFVLKYRRLLQEANADKDFYIKSRMLNIWRCCPFLDIEPIIDDLEVHGVPVSLSEIAMHPVGTDPDSFAAIKDTVVDPFEHSELVASIAQATLIFAGISIAFGLPPLVADEAGKDKPIDWQFFNDAMRRGIKSQASRNARRHNGY